MTNQINATAPTPQDWIDLVRENETLRQQLESKMTEQRKTVEDAVEWLGEEWPGDTGDVMCYDHEKGWAVWHLDWEDCFSFYQVCTREEFEACVAAKKANSEPEWTHEYKGYLCKIALSKPDSYGNIIILNEYNVYIRCSKEDVKPIKPTITKSEAWDIAVEEDVSPQYVMSEYTITD